LVAGVEGNSGAQIKIIVAFKSETFDLCEGNERPFEEQRAGPITSPGHQLEFPKGQIAVGESFDVCEVSGGFSDCKTLTDSPSNQPAEVPLTLNKCRSNMHLGKLASFVYLYLLLDC
jgi:hypothetical protein